MVEPMKHLFVLAAVALLVPANGRAADGTGIGGRWSVSLQGGTDLELSGDYQGAGKGAVLGLATTVEPQGYKEIFGRSFRGGLSIGYGVSRSVEVFARGGHYNAKVGGPVTIGTAETLPLLAEFGTYDEWSAEAGARYYIHSSGPLRVYAAGVAGARFLAAAPVALSVPDASVFLTDLAFYDSSVVGVFGADLGVSRDLSRHVALGIEIGLRYQTRPSGLDASLAGTGLEAMNDEGSRWSVPILGQVAFRF